MVCPEKACYVCPCCGGDLILKAGEVKAAHFAHREGSDCDDFTHDMSDWHKWWQSQFPVQCREAPFESNGERHRADVAIDTVDFEKGEYTDGGDILVRGGVAYPLERIVWCIDRNGGGDYSRFITEYYPLTAAELKEFVKEECVKRRRRKASASS